MEWTGLNELREKYLQFFESKQHLRLPSFSLVPQGDKSLLLINSGMAPMKKWFLGTEQPPSHRVTTCQKCIRTPDIESVGITDRHGTYFEMLGNFSFQNYFKPEAIAWAWEFFTSKEWLAIPPEKLFISVYQDDNDAWDIWTNDIGVPPQQMVRLGKADNFWEHGSGPCGPCSEIYFDRGKEHGCDDENCKPGCECDRFIEVWNLVFTEFDSDGAGNYEKLAKPNIDTGMGLERLACVMQGAANLFETDTVQHILKHVERLSGKTYGEDKKTDVSIRVITDHIRSTTFMVADGVLPSNEGRGYVLRRLLRRAARHGRMIGILDPFLADVCDTVVQQNKDAYPELDENKSYIQKIIALEEERFARTIDAGLERLNEVVTALKEGDFETVQRALIQAGHNVQERMRATMEHSEEVQKVIPGEIAFRLHDTFGFPLDLTREIAEESGITVDVEAFKQALQRQRQKAQADRAGRDIAGWQADMFTTLDAPATEFVGYEHFTSEATVVAISEDGEQVEAVSIDDGPKDGIMVVLDKTPFYAEGGGQVADIGFLTGDGARLRVQDVKKTGKGYYVHSCTLQQANIRVGQRLLAEVDQDRRREIMRNHTSAHLLQRALTEVLGEHVRQAGSYVDDERMRFDFTHFSAMKPQEIREVEKLVNHKIFEALKITVHNLPLEEAKKMGAVALFGEKYSGEVRVIDAEGWSTELCGGTHVNNTSELGSFKIISESGVAAGVRRIESTTGWGVLRMLDERENMLHNMATSMKLAAFGELPTRLAQLANENKRLQKELESLQDKAADAKAKDLFGNAVDVQGVKVFAAFLKNTGPDALRKMGDMMRDNEPSSVSALVGEAGGKTQLLVCCGPGAVEKGLAAGVLAKQLAAIAGGSGGGKPDFAMAGIKDATKVDELLAQVVATVEANIK